MLTPPLRFTNTDQFDEWTKRFEERAEEICRSHNAMDVWDKAVMLKDRDKLEYGINGFRTAVVANSNQHKAQDDLLNAFEEMFGDGTFMNLRGV